MLAATPRTPDLGQSAFYPSQSDRSDDHVSYSLSSPLVGWRPKMRVKNVVYAG